MLRLCFVVSVNGSQKDALAGTRARSGARGVLEVKKSEREIETEKGRGESGRPQRSGREERVRACVNSAASGARHA